jgi:hypothetical protein
MARNEYESTSKSFYSRSYSYSFYQWVKHKGTKRNWEKGSIIFVGLLLAIPVFFVSSLRFMVFGGRKVKQKKMLKFAARKAEEDKNPIGYAKITTILFMNVSELSRN